jgi:hypothetical protein
MRLSPQCKKRRGVNLDPRCCRAEKPRSRDMHCPVRGIPCDWRWCSFLIEHRLATTRGLGSTVNSAWKSRHELAENACTECQGSTYVPGPMYEGRMVDECSECKGTGMEPTKHATDVVSLA